MRGFVVAALAAALACAGCASREARLRQALETGRGRVRLAGGVTEVTSELAVPEKAHDLEIVGAPEGSLLRAANSFRGRAVLVLKGASKVRLSGFAIDGNRGALEFRADLPPSDVAFARFTPNNGILAEGVKGLRIERVRFSNIAGFAVLASACENVVVEGAQVEAGGSRNPAGKNNATGGILLEEGTRGFRVLRCAFRNVRGNGVWTHSLYASPRNTGGLIAGNRFEQIGRDAIQVGHASLVRVEENSGERIGYPFEEVDVQGGAIPVALDTAGDVDGSRYASNRFRQVNGKCIDLDGFHHGEVSGNECVNPGRAGDYPHGHYGIVFNNSNPDMFPEGIVVSGNLINGAKFGGVFVIGSGNRIEGNRLVNLNLAHCNDSGARFGCLYDPSQPDLLRSGIYLGAGGRRPAPARGNVIRGNQVSGYGMRRRCVTTAPGVPPGANRVEANRCE